MPFSCYDKIKTQQSSRGNQLYYGILIFNGIILRLALTRRKTVMDAILQNSEMDQLFRDLHRRSTSEYVQNLKIFKVRGQARRGNSNVSIADWYITPYSCRFCSAPHGIYYSTGTWRMFTFQGH